MKSKGKRAAISMFFRNTMVPLFLICCCPPTAILMWYTNVTLGGSLQKLWEGIQGNGFWSVLYEAWQPVFWGSKQAWSILAVFMIVQVLIMRLVPGKPFYGPVTPAGNVPVYKANGVVSFLATLFLFCFSSFYMGWFSPTIIYDHMGELLGALNLFSLAFCTLLYLKGRFKPSSTDAGCTGNFIFDYYWGTELYPRVLGCDVKMFTNCRFGLAGWALILISFAAKQHATVGLSDSMLLAVFLQLVYIAKFFVWETGYLGSLDIMHDRAGFYICWGCLVWVPSIYTSSTLYLVGHPYHLGPFWFTTILVLGCASILMNYFADRQRQYVRAMNGECKVWRKDPILIIANYTTQQGQKKQSLLLASGFWGISRHFHYLPEILGALFWTIPIQADHFLPYFYVIFLTMLLCERAIRDDRRCARKYGDDWMKYCAKVPYKVIPFVF